MYRIIRGSLKYGLCNRGLSYSDIFYDDDDELTLYPKWDLGEQLLYLILCSMNLLQSRTLGNFLNDYRW